MASSLRPIATFAAGSFVLDCFCWGRGALAAFRRIIRAEGDAAPRFPKQKALTFAAVLFSATFLSAAAPPPAQSAPAPKPAAAPASSVKTEGDTVVMPKFEVSASRIREIDKTIKQLEKLVRREKQSLEKSTLDDTVNSEKVSKVAALFGGKSTVQRASVSAVRIQSMEKEISILESLRTPMTAADRALAEKLVADERTYRRELDITLR